ncbi:MAG: DUF4112 domain-containing protein [Sandaracinaceae bacterium]
MTTNALTFPAATHGGDPDVRVKKAADAAVERIMGDKASPALKRAASEAVAPWAARMVRVLDDWMLDPIIGFILPGAGDAITGTGSIALLFLALKERVPTVVLLRMCLNILVDTVGGVFPIVGDAFDLVWRSNKRNLNLIEKFKGDTDEKPGAADYGIVAGGVLLAIASILLPIFMFYGVGAGLLWALLG